MENHSRYFLSRRRYKELLTQYENVIVKPLNLNEDIQRRGEFVDESKESGDNGDVLKIHVLHKTSQHVGPNLDDVTNEDFVDSFSEVIPTFLCTSLI